MTGISRDKVMRAMASATRIASSNQMASWLDQGLVSATNFAVLIMLARWAGVAEVGYYAVGFSILSLAMVAQDSLVTRPYAIQLFKPPGGPGAHAYGAMVLGAVLSAAIGICLALAGMLLSLLGSYEDLAGLFLVLAIAVPLALGREFARRFSFANLLMRHALVVDAMASGVLLALLVSLAWSGMLVATTALGAMGVAGGISAAVWFAMRRGVFVRQQDAARQTARNSWSFGKWLLSSQIALQVQGYAAHWITLAVAGAATTGLYSACLSIVSLSNPFLFGLFNVLTPNFVRVLKDKGEQGLRREALKSAAVVGGVMATFTLAIVLGGDLLMAALFPRAEFAGGAKVLSILALSSAVAALGAPATIALSAAERGRAVAGLALAACAVGSVVVWVLLLGWGLVGAAWGILVTEALGTAARWSLLVLGERKPIMDQTAMPLASTKSAIH